MANFVRLQKVLLFACSLLISLSFGEEIEFYNTISGGGQLCYFENIGETI